MTESKHSGARPWCCAHKWTLGYITFVVTIELFLLLFDAFT